MENVRARAIVVLRATSNRRTHEQQLSRRHRSNDFRALESLLSNTIEFGSPVAHTPYRDPVLVAEMVRNVADIFENFEYIEEYDASSSAQALVFRATIDGLELTGCDFIHFDKWGAVDKLTVMVRPLSATNALATRMAERFGSIQERAAARRTEATGA